MNKPEYMKWALEARAPEVVNKPLAIVIMGNPRYIDEPKIRNKATALYCRIKMFLQNRYEVRFDAGKPFTLPDTHAKLWVAHSRGIDRLQYAPNSIKTIALQTQDYDRQYETVDQQGQNPLHYELSEQDVKALMSA